ncbi:serine hydrolase domain-containing protein [Ilumatobacter nonamiensis]|uniref:serine hydrolase domain-containing protein n=1 Tax=Ilumatobacter nonamiensis TaxID=467093 RepID=UPI0003466B95|nr:serine hydrolase domain-containing protein [Ilumatobacter nonamiensis]
MPRQRVRDATALVIVLGAVVLGCGSDSASTEREDTIAALADAVTEEMERTGAPGMEVAVRFGDGEEWIEQFGIGDVESGTEVAGGMTWPLRSVTKSFVVDVLLELADEGVVSLDDTVDEYVDGVEADTDITLRELADMSSGLPEYANEKFVTAFLDDVSRSFTDEELLAFVDGDPLDFEPGTEHVYVNTNTLLVGMIVAAATDESVGDLLRSRIFDPLGLETALYAPTASDIAGSVPTGYQSNDGALVEAPLTFGVFGGSGAMAATIEDLLAWGPVLADGGLLADGGDEQRSIARPLDAGPEYDSYGLGIGHIDGWWGHTGEGLGYTALVMSDTESGMTVAVVTNISDLADDEHLPTTLFRRFATILGNDT